MEIEFLRTHIMPTSHWHGQVEVNVPFDGDVEYLINNGAVNINQGHQAVLGLYTAPTNRYRNLSEHGDF